MAFKFEKLSVLVVEDTIPMRKLVISVLDTLGIGRIFTANDGEAGFDIFRRENPDIVLTDWHMIPVNGLELVKLIRNSPQSPNRMVSIIMMTENHLDEPNSEYQSKQYHQIQSLQNFLNL